MHSRFVYSLVIVCLCATHGSAQTVRFDTNVGNFDVVLNPDPNLHVLIANMLAYVEEVEGVEGGRYDKTVINRAVDGDDEDPANDFVLQMGSFRIDSIFPPSTSDGFSSNPIERFGAVIVDEDNNGEVDFATDPNVRGTVSLALSSGPNTGTSSFFINLGDNTNRDNSNPEAIDLDSRGFVPFATIPDMTTIDLIMQLNNVDVYSMPTNLTFSDMPLIDNGSLVFIEEARVLDTPVGAPAGLSSGSVGPGVAAVPEPSSLALAAAALMFTATSVRRGVKSRVESRESEIVRAG